MPDFDDPEGFDLYAIHTPKRKKYCLVYCGPRCDCGVGRKHPAEITIDIPEPSLYDDGMIKERPSDGTDITSDTDKKQE